MKKTYGQQVNENNAKTHNVEDDVIDYRLQMEKFISRDLHQKAYEASQHSLYRGKDFYMVILFKVEKIGHAIRSFCFARRSCPTPVYKQAVWKYHTKSGALEFLWSIPDQIQYYHILRNAPTLLKDKETQQLAQFCVLMESGDLLEWVKKENGEKIDAIIYNKEVN